MAILLKSPYGALPAQLLFQGKAFGLGIDVLNLRTLGKAATFTAAASSGVLEDVVSEQARRLGLFVAVLAASMGKA